MSTSLTEEKIRLFFKDYSTIETLIHDRLDKIYEKELRKKYSHGYYITDMNFYDDDCVTCTCNDPYSDNSSIREFTLTIEEILNCLKEAQGDSYV